MKKLVSKRIRITKKGDVLRRAMGLGHNRSKKRTTQIKRKTKRMRKISIGKNLFKIKV